MNSLDRNIRKAVKEIIEVVADDLEQEAFRFDWDEDYIKGLNSEDRKEYIKDTIRDMLADVV